MKRFVMITTLTLAVLAIPAHTSARLRPAGSAILMPAVVPPPTCPPICH